MRASWRTAWQGHEIVVFRDDAEADRFDAEQIQRVMLVHRGDGESPKRSAFVVPARGGAYAGFTTRF